MLKTLKGVKELRFKPVSAWVVIGLAAVGATISVTAPQSAAQHPHHGDSDHNNPNSADTHEMITTINDVPQNAGRIIGSPEPGPYPQNHGDRGGLLQLATLGALVMSLGFIIWRVTRAAKTTNTTSQSNRQQPHSSRQHMA